MVDKSADSVLDEVESAIYQVAQQILNGEGFTYGIPSRAKGNQMYIPELDRIVLKDSKLQRPFASTSTCRKAVITTRVLQLIHELCLKRIHVTKRDLFYTDVKLFEVCNGCSCAVQLHCVSHQPHQPQAHSPPILQSCQNRHPSWLVQHGVRSLYAATSVCTTCLVREATSGCTLQEQGNSDSTLDDVACLLGCTRSSLHGETTFSNSTQCSTTMTCLSCACTVICPQLLRLAAACIGLWAACMSSSQSTDSVLVPPIMQTLKCYVWKTCMSSAHHNVSFACSGGLREGSGGGQAELQGRW